MATEAGTTDIPGNLEPKRSYSTVEQPAFWPIMTSKVTGQVSGRDRLRILINEATPTTKEPLWAMLQRKSGLMS